MSQLISQALWHIDTNKTVLKNANIHPIERSVLIRGNYSMISTGTERLVAMGGAGQLVGQKMTVPYMEGSFKLPIKYGYSFVGTKEDGTLIHALHPHQDITYIRDADIYTISRKNIPPIRLTLISNMETVVNAIWDSNPSKVMRIAVCGFGNIGSLLANTLRVLNDIEVEVIENNFWRRNKAKEMGWKVGSSDYYDIVYHTTCTAEGLQFSIDHTALDGKVIELSWYGNEIISINLGGNFHHNRVKIIGSQVSNIPFHKRGDHDFKSRKDLVVQLLEDKSYDKLISKIIPFKDTPKFFDKLRRGNQEPGLIYIIKY